jgi:hypothetical protein
MGRVENSLKCSRSEKKNALIPIISFTKEELRVERCPCQQQLINIYPFLFSLYIYSIYIYYKPKNPIFSLTVQRAIGLSLRNNPLDRGSFRELSFVAISADTRGGPIASLLVGNAN